MKALKSPSRKGQRVSQGGKRDHRTEADDLESDRGNDSPDDENDDIEESALISESPIVTTTLPVENETPAPVSPSFAAKKEKQQKTAEERIYEKFRKIYGPGAKKDKRPKVQKDIELKDDESIADVYLNRSVSLSIEGTEFDDIFRVQNEEMR